MVRGNTRLRNSFYILIHFFEILVSSGPSSGHRFCIAGKRRWNSKNRIIALSRLSKNRRDKKQRNGNNVHAFIFEWPITYIMQIVTKEIIQYTLRHRDDANRTQSVENIVIQWTGTGRNAYPLITNSIGRRRQENE